MRGSRARAESTNLAHIKFAIVWIAQLQWAGRGPGANIRNYQLGSEELVSSEHWRYIDIIKIGLGPLYFLWARYPWDEALNTQTI